MVTLSDLHHVKNHFCRAQYCHRDNPLYKNTTFANFIKIMVCLHLAGGAYRIEQVHILY